MADRKALVIVGSPRGAKSTSESIGDYIMGGLEKRGVQAEKTRLVEAMAGNGGRKKLICSVYETDVIVLVFPVYLDSLPALVTEALELISETRGTKGGAGQMLLAVSNCGFPEVVNNDIALRICREFAREAGFIWAGGLGLGGGESTGQRPLEQLGGMTRRLRMGLDMAASALAEGKPVPEEAYRLVSKPLIPAWLYRWFGNRWHRKEAGKNRSLDVKARPYRG